MPVISPNVKVEIISGKKNDREWKGLKLTVGEWTTVIFPKSRFELDYIEKFLEENK